MHEFTTEHPVVQFYGVFELLKVELLVSFQQRYWRQR